MSRLKTIGYMIAVLSVAGFEVHLIAGACKCMCYAVSGVPAEFDVDVDGNCNRDFEYTYKVHFGTNDDCDSSPFLTVYGSAYAGTPSVNVQNHAISPTSFAIAGAGHTETFTVTGDLENDNCDGVSATVVADANNDCVADSDETSVDIRWDDADCGAENCP